MINLSEVVAGATCRAKDVPIREVADGIRIYRKTVKEADLLKYAKSCLLEALHDFQQLEEREFSLLLTSKAGNEADSLKAVVKYVDGWQVGAKADYICHAQDKIRTAFAILQYMGIANEEKEFSNFLLK